MQLFDQFDAKYVGRITEVYYLNCLIPTIKFDTNCLMFAAGVGEIFVCLVINLSK